MDTVVDRELFPIGSMQLIDEEERKTNGQSVKSDPKRSTFALTDNDRELRR